jgi:hypothetical protein
MSEIIPNGIAGWPSWSAEEHLRLMDRGGVATAMLSISSPGTRLPCPPARSGPAEVEDHYLRHGDVVGIDLGAQRNVVKYARATRTVGSALAFPTDLRARIQARRSRTALARTTPGRLTRILR